MNIYNLAVKSIISTRADLKNNLPPPLLLPLCCSLKSSHASVDSQMVCGWTTQRRQIIRVQVDCFYGRFSSLLKLSKGLNMSTTKWDVAIIKRVKIREFLSNRSFVALFASKPSFFEVIFLSIFSS